MYLLKFPTESLTKFTYSPVMYLQSKSYKDSLCAHSAPIHMNICNFCISYSLVIVRVIIMLLFIDLFQLISFLPNIFHFCIFCHCCLLACCWWCLSPDDAVWYTNVQHSYTCIYRCMHVVSERTTHIHLWVNFSSL